MLTRRHVLTRGTLGLAASVALPWAVAATRAEEAFAVSHSDDEWHKLLTADQFAVLRKSATERPFTSPLLHEERARHFRLRGLRPRSVFLEDEVRQPHRLAELLGAAGHMRSEQRATPLRHDHERRCIAAAAAAISATFSTTVRSRRACAIA